MQKEVGRGGELWEREWEGVNGDGEEGVIGGWVEGGRGVGGVGGGGEEGGRRWGSCVCTEH